jgi:hypothetical protein
MITLGLVLLAVSTPAPRSAVPAVESPPAPTLEPYEARKVIAPHVSRIKSCQVVRLEEVVCLVVRRRHRESAHAVRHRLEPSGSTKDIRVFYTPGWSKLAS